MKLTKTPLQDLVIVETNYFQDERGFFIETWNKKDFSAAGLNSSFVVQAHSGSKHKVLRGLHFQNMEAPMEKLVRCIHGKVFEVAVDIRKTSPTFGKWFGIELSSENKKQLFVPIGFALGFSVLSDFAEVLYSLTAYQNPSKEAVLQWNDKNLAINWPHTKPILSKRDAHGITFQEYKKNPSFL